MAPLVLVVGPSGAGKDTLLQGAAGTLQSCARFAFPRREITRAPSALEDCITVSPEDFETRRAAGDYCLSWHAHGLAYGVPRSIEELLAAGRAVSLNVSRTVIEEANRRFDRVHVVAVTASRDVLRARLNGRRRETPDEIERRLDRAEAFAVSAPALTTLTNDGAPEDAVSAFVSLLERLHPANG